MAIVTFWSESKKEVGQTTTAIAVATQMAIEHNMKVLLISTYNRKELDKAFWKEEKTKKGLSAIFTSNKKFNIDVGINGLVKEVTSNKITPEIIKNYTTIVFKDRLDVLDGYNDTGISEEIFSKYPDIINYASNYYDIVIVDLDRETNRMDVVNKILQISTVIVNGLNQRNSSLNQYIESKSSGIHKGRKNIIPYLGRYDKFSKYNSKNIARFIKEGKDMSVISYNTLFNEACDEGTVVDLFLRLKTVKTIEDKNIQFYNEVKELSESIIYKIQEIKMKM